MSSRVWFLTWGGAPYRMPKGGADSKSVGGSIPLLCSNQEVPGVNGEEPSPGRGPMLGCRDLGDQCRSCAKRPPIGGRDAHCAD